MMKVLHVPFTFAPDAVGGTEVYVEELVQELQCFGIGSVIAAPSHKGVDESYDYKSLRVLRFRINVESQHMLRELYGQGDPEASAAFAEILDQERPDVVHIHALTRAISILLVRAAKARRLPVIFTYHTPAASCQRGTLMLMGARQCDGLLLPARCTSCTLENAGLPIWAGRVLSSTPSLVARLVERARLDGGVWTALRMSDLIRARCEGFRQIVQEVDHIVALREWVRALLIRNGVAASKISLSEHGLSLVRKAHTSPVDVNEMPLRVAFLGRADRVKGIDTLIRAVRSATNLDIKLDLYGISQGAGDDKYQNELKTLAVNEPRISFHPPVPHDEVVELLRQYHLLAVPSRWLETGPLVILEAFAAGTPVIGSDLGGIAELVRPDVNGLLIPFDDIDGWTHALRRCAEDRKLLAQLRIGVTPPRTMKEVAQEMSWLYSAQISRH